MCSLLSTWRQSFHLKDRGIPYHRRSCRLALVAQPWIQIETTVIFLWNFCWHFMPFKSTIKMVTIVLMLMVNRMTLIMTRMRSMPTVCLRVLGRPLLLATSLSSVKVHLFAKVCLTLLRFFRIALYSVFFPGAECFLFTLSLCQYFVGRSLSCLSFFSCQPHSLKNVKNKTK